MAERSCRPLGTTIKKLWYIFNGVYQGKSYHEAIYPEIFENDLLEMQGNLTALSETRFWGRLPRTDIEANFIVTRDAVIIRPAFANTLDLAIYEATYSYPTIPDLIVQ